MSEAPEREPYTGLPIDLPPGQHPFDWYIAALVNTLGWRKSAIYLGITDEEIDHGQTET